MTTNETYLNTIAKVITQGRGIGVRTQDTLEVMHNRVEIDMQYPIITVLGRELDYCFMASEALWILTGQRILDERVRKNLAKYSDDGLTMSGAYGPPFLQQLRYVAETLNAEDSSRQAVITLWHPMPRASKDIPCTICVHFLVRNNHLYTNVYMRSSDVWLGLPYDIFTFTMMSLLLQTMIDKTPHLGKLFITAGSQHLYHRHFESAFQLKPAEFDINTIQHREQWVEPADITSALQFCTTQPDPTKWPIICQ